MTRRSQWSALAWAISLAVAAALVAYLLAGGPWAAAGAVIGAVTGAFAPSVYDGLRGRSVRDEAWRGTVQHPPPQSWARLLDPRREVVAFVGRDSELTALVAWCEDDDAGRLRLVTGPGGVGKTRLSVELAERMKQLGWRAEQIGDGKEAAAIAALRAVTPGRALLVVDYAETRTGLSQMLAGLAGDQGKGVRVLLLARSTGDWWDQLGVRDPAVWDLIQDARQAQFSLAPVVAADLSDAEIIALAVRSFATAVSLPERTVEIYGDRDGGQQRRVLDLHAAALVAVLADASTGPVRVDIRTVLGELLRHEQHFWYDSARARGLSDGQDGTTARMLRQLVAAACLLGAASQDEARVLPSLVPGMFLSAKITEWLRALYPPDPGQTDWIGSLQPDRLAELHTLRELDASPELGQTCLTGLDARQALRAVTLLARASADYPEAEGLLSQTLPDVTDLITRMHAPAETLTAIFNAIPYPTVVLAPAAVALSQEITSHLPADTEPAARAYWLSNLGVRLAELGRTAEALPATEEAAAIYRELAATNPDRYRFNLAYTLDHLGSRLSDLGRPTEALPAAEEAVAVRRELVATNPDRYRSDLPDQYRSDLPDQYRRDLATSLSNLGIRFFELGRSAEGLRVAEEASAIYRELAAAYPDQYRPNFAAALNNLGNRLSELGRPAEALPVAEEAVAVFRELAAAKPDRHRPNLATTLENLGVRFSELGRPAEALSATEEALAIRRELAAATPDRYRPDLARSLDNLGVRLAELGRTAEGLPATEEAAAIYRELAATNPDRYRPDLACSLVNLGVRFSELGRPGEGLPVAEEAAAIYRELAATNPDRYRPDLARSLDNLGVRLAELGRTAEGLPATEEAAAMYRELAATNPDRYRPDLACSLVNLGVRFSELGRPGEGLPVAEEAAAIYRELAATNPDRYHPDLARSLDNLSEFQNALGRKGDTEAAHEEAAKLRAQPGR